MFVCIRILWVAISDESTDFVTILAWCWGEGIMQHMFLLFFVKFLKNICCAEMENKIFNTYFNSYFPFILHTWKPLECIILRLLPFCIMASCYQNLTPLQIIFYYVAIFFQVTDIVKQSTIWPWNSSSPMLWNPVELPGSSVQGIFQARILEQVAISYSRDSSRPGIKLSSLVSPALAGRFFTTAPPGKPRIILVLSN